MSNLIDERLELLSQTYDWMAKEFELLKKEIAGLSGKDIRNNKQLRKLRDSLLAKAHMEVREGKRLIKDISHSD